MPPGIADLPRLARQMAEAGIRVTIRIDPPAPQVAPSVDLSAYRIIQEALTNALKHGGAQSASVTVRYDGRAVHIEVHDDGRGAPAGYHPGRGLLGITERSRRSAAASNTAGVSTAGSGCRPCSRCHDCPGPGGR